jgi:protein-S-isoprenylcysteine O-methyltransferase Ste14
VFAPPFQGEHKVRPYENMPLQEDFENLGNRLFRWRSYLPLLLGVLFILALLNHQPAAAALGPDWTWQFDCLLVSLTGLGIRFYTVGFAPRGTSGRNTRGQVAEVLNTTGMYSVVRNPLYLGNFLIWLGLALFIKVWWCVVIVVLFFILFYERIIFAEERFLREKFGATFFAWAEKTPAIIPRLKNWRPSDLAFSWKSALVREYSSFFAAIASFTVLAFIKDSLEHDRLTLDKTWIEIFLVGLIIYLTVRTLKKKTQILRTVDR